MNSSQPTQLLEEIKEILCVYESGGDLWIEEQGWEENEQEIIKAINQYKMRLLQQVREMIGEDEYSAMMNGQKAQDGWDDARNRLRHELRQKIDALEKGEEV